MQPIYPIERVKVFATGLAHPEGVAFDDAGWLYTGTARPGYNDAGAIYRVSPDGRKIEEFANTGGRVLGLAFNGEGSLFVCDGLLGAVFRVDSGGKVELFADHAGQHRLLKPNFLTFDRTGNLYVSDSGTAKAGEPTGAVYRFTPDGEGTVFFAGLVFANGLALEANGDALFVVETRDNRVLRIPIGADGIAGTPTVYVHDLKNGPDGLALDKQGNLYVTVTRPSYLVRVSPTGRREVLVSDPADRLLHAPSNLAFGGVTGKQLFIANLFGQHIAVLTLD